MDEKQANKNKTDYGNGTTNMLLHETHKQTRLNIITIIAGGRTTCSNSSSNCSKAALVVVVIVVVVVVAD